MEKFDKFNCKKCGMVLEVKIVGSSVDAPIHCDESMEFEKKPKLPKPVLARTGQRAGPGPSRPNF